MIKRLWFFSFVAVVPVFFLLLHAGTGYPLLNLYRDSSVVPEPVEYNLFPEMVFVQGDEYTMGGTMAASSSAKPAHQVLLSSFEISKCEITFGLFDLFCFDTDRAFPPDLGAGRGDRPVTCVSWYDAVEFCNWLSCKAGLDACYTVYNPDTDPDNLGTYDMIRRRVQCDFQAGGYRLPTEAEWEYAAAGGINRTDTVYAGSNQIEEVAWYFDNGSRVPERTGLKQPNELGLYDMSGNAYEWTWDWYYKNYSWCAAVEVDPAGVKSGSSKVIRGGSCFFDYKGAAVVYRKTAPPDCRLPYIGFRVVKRAESK